LQAWLGGTIGGNAMPHRGRRRHGRKAALEAEVEDICETNTFKSTSISQSEYKMQDIEMNKNGDEQMIADAKDATLAKPKCEAQAEPRAEAHEPYTDANKNIGKEDDDDDDSEDEGSSSQLSPKQALLRTKEDCVIASRYLFDVEVQGKMEAADHARLVETVLKVRDRLTQHPRPSFAEAGKMMSLMENLRTMIEMIYLE